MGDPDDEALARARDRTERYGVWLEHLRGGDPALAEASALYPPDMSEWQSPVCLLTGNVGVWRELGGRVMQERSIGPVIEDLDSPGAPMGVEPGCGDAMDGAFWDVDRWPAKCPYVFEQFLFYGWVTACHLRQRIPPALTATGAGS
jgi:hypothetical protein